MDVQGFSSLCLLSPHIWMEFTDTHATDPVFVWVLGIRTQVPAVLWEILLVPESSPKLTFKIHFCTSFLNSSGHEPALRNTTQKFEKY